MTQSLGGASFLSEYQQKITCMRKEGVPPALRRCVVIYKNKCKRHFLMEGRECKAPLFLPSLTNHSRERAGQKKEFFTFSVKSLKHFCLHPLSPKLHNMRHIYYEQFDFASLMAMKKNLQNRTNETLPVFAYEVHFFHISCTRSCATNPWKNEQ